MRTKVTLVLIFLNVALFFFIFGFERKWRTEEFAREARRRVLGPEAANIQALTLAGPGLAHPISLHRNGDAWLITKPYEWPANPFAVGRIVTELQFLEHEATFAVDDLSDSGVGLADYGLAEPALRVTLHANADASDAGTTLAIGKKTEIGDRLYVLSPEGDRVHVVSRTLADALTLNLDELRAATCFSIREYEVLSLNLQNAGPANTRVRIRRDGNRWAFESPIVARADAVDTRSTIIGLNTLRTTRFFGAAESDTGAAADPVALAGTSTPALRITLEGTNRRETLLLGNPAGEAAPEIADGKPGREFYARMEDRNAIFTVVMPDALLNTLRSAQSELRDPHVLDLAGRTVDSVTLSAPGREEVVLQQLERIPGAPAGTPSGWQVVQRGADGSLRTQPADRAVVVDQLLRDLARLRAEEFVRDAPSEKDLEDWGLRQRPDRTITVTYAAEAGVGTAPVTATTSDTLLIGTNQDGSRTYAKLQRESFVYRIDPAILAATPVDPLHYRQRILRDLPAGAKLIGMSLRDLSTGNVIYTHDLAADETWEQAFARAPAGQRQALAQLRTELRTLEARRFVADQFSDKVVINGEERPWRFRLDAILSLSGDADEERVESALFLADRDGGDLQLVGAPGFNVVFEAKQPLIDAVWSLSYAARDPGPIEMTPPPAGATVDEEDAAASETQPAADSQP